MKLCPKRWFVRKRYVRIDTGRGVKAAYDAACKRLLANKMILAWVMPEIIITGEY